MANIVELREMSDDKLEEMLEESREEVFNLRFQEATSRLDDYSRMKKVRRQIAQLETVLHTRRLAVEAALTEPAVADALRGREWASKARFDYEESAWLVDFEDDSGRRLAHAAVNLNRKQPRGRRRRHEALASPVLRYEVEG